jgi:hypothetical protein
LGLDHPPYEGQGCGVAARLAATGMGARCNLSGRAPALQQLFQKRLADAEQGRERPLGAEVLIVGPQDFLSKVERVGFHAS